MRKFSFLLFLLTLFFGQVGFSKTVNMEQLKSQYDKVTSTLSENYLEYTNLAKSFADTCFRNDYSEEEYGAYDELDGEERLQLFINYLKPFATQYSDIKNSFLLSDDNGVINALGVASFSCLDKNTEQYFSHFMDASFSEFMSPFNNFMERRFLEKYKPNKEKLKKLEAYYTKNKKTILSKIKKVTSKDGVETIKMNFNLFEQLFPLVKQLSW